MIYVGYYRADLTLADDRFPELRTMFEGAMIRWGVEHVEDLEGLYVNRVFLLDKIPADRIVVVRQDGSEFRLTDHPKWKTWRDEMSASEFYSFLDPNQRW